MMGESDSRFRQYYSEDEYKGFRKRSAMSSQATGRIRLIFSNGDQEIEATGDFTEDALSEIFDKVDTYHAQKGSSMNQ